MTRKVVVIAQDQVAANTEKLLGVYGAGEWSSS